MTRMIPIPTLLWTSSEIGSRRGNGRSSSGCGISSISCDAGGGGGGAVSCSCLDSNNKEEDLSFWLLDFDSLVVVFVTFLLRLDFLDILLLTIYSPVCGNL